MQLSLLARLLSVTLFVACATVTARAHAQLSVEAASTIFHEAGGPLSMTVVVPEVNASV